MPAGRFQVSLSVRLFTGAAVLALACGGTLEEASADPLPGHVAAASPAAVHGDPGTTLCAKVEQGGCASRRPGESSDSR